MRDPIFVYGVPLHGIIAGIVHQHLLAFILEGKADYAEPVSTPSLPQSLYLDAGAQADVSCGGDAVHLVLYPPESNAERLWSKYEGWIWSNPRGKLIARAPDLRASRRALFDCGTHCVSITRMCKQASDLEIVAGDRECVERAIERHFAWFELSTARVVGVLNELPVTQLSRSRVRINALASKVA